MTIRQLGETCVVYLRSWKVPKQRRCRKCPKRMTPLLRKAKSTCQNRMPSSIKSLQEAVDDWVMVNDRRAGCRLKRYILVSWRRKREEHSPLAPPIFANHGRSIMYPWLQTIVMARTVLLRKSQRRGKAMTSPVDGEKVCFLSLHAWCLEIKLKFCSIPLFSKQFVFLKTQSQWAKVSETLHNVLAERKSLFWSFLAVRQVRGFLFRSAL